MANLTFPTNPTNGQKYTFNGKVFEYSSSTGRWSATRAQLLGSLPDDVTIDAPTLSVSLSTIALDTVGANVYVTYTVDQDVDARLSVSGLENTTATLHKSNNTIVVTAGATEFANGQINLVVSNGRSTDTEVINVSASYINFETMPFGTATNGGFFTGIIDTTQGNIIAADDYQTGSRYALIVSPKDYESGGSLTWDSLDRAGQSGSFTRWDGLSSTNSILAKNDSAYQAFELIRTLRTTNPVPNDGGSDWYLPAMDELELMYRNLKPVTNLNDKDWTISTFPGTRQDFGFNPSSDPTGAAYFSGFPGQTSVTAFQTGGAEVLGQSSYWSSTDANEADEAWRQAFLQTNTHGLQRANAKNASYGVRPVRRILI